MCSLVNNIFRKIIRFNIDCSLPKYCLLENINITHSTRTNVNLSILSHCGISSPSENVFDCFRPPSGVVLYFYTGEVLSMI